MPVHFSPSRIAVAVVCTLLSLQGAHAQAEPAEPVDNSPLNGAMLFQLVVGELEFQNGKPAAGYQLMLDAARRTREESLFRRATDMALKAGDGVAAITAIEAWREALPQSFNASVYEVRILLELNRPADAAAAARSMLKLAAPADRATSISVLPRLFSRNKNRTETAALLEPVLQPWLADPIAGVVAQVSLGRVLLAAGNPARAFELATKAHAQNPSAEAPPLLALELMPTTPEADIIIKGYLQAKPAGTPLRIVYARLLASMQRYAEAAEQLEFVTRQEPQLAAPWLTLGAIHLELKQPRQAIMVANEYLKRERNGEVVPIGTPTSAPQPDNAPDEDDGEDDPAGAPREQAYFILAKAAEQLRDFTGAEVWLDKITTPARALDVLSRRAALLVAQGKQAKALEMVRRAPETTPESGRGKAMLEAQLMSDAKQWAGAEKVLDAANKRYPNDTELLYQQAMVAEKLDRLADMERLLRRVIDIRPDHHHAYNALGYSLAERNLRLQEARALIVTALEIAPGEPFITDSLGWVEYRLGNRAEALRHLTQAYRLRPDVEIGVHLGEVLWVDGQRDEARRVLREAQKRDASNEVLRSTLARLKVDL
jgi:tetratricopeptide (TPR) repeat protein